MSAGALWPIGHCQLEREKWLHGQVGQQGIVSCREEGDYQGQLGQYGIARMAGMQYIQGRVRLGWTGHVMAWQGKKCIGGSVVLRGGAQWGCQWLSRGSGSTTRTTAGGGTP